MNESRFLKAYIHESCLHTGQHTYHLTLIDIANNALGPGALNVDFLEHAIFNYRNTGLHRRNIDQDFFTHSGASIPNCCNKQQVS